VCDQLFPASHLTRVDWRRWRKEGVHLVAWTVNNKEEKHYFHEVLKIPFITDNPAVDSNVPEQST